MKQKRTKHSKEFKREAVELMKTKEHTTLARQLGVHLSLLYKWRDSIEKHGEHAFPGQGHRTEPPSELELLKIENDQLRMENEFLKKTAIFFAQNSPSSLNTAVSSDMKPNTR